MHFICKGLHSCGQFLHLLGKLINVSLFQFLNYGGKLFKLIDEGGHIGLTQLRQGTQAISKGSELIAVRPPDICQSRIQGV